MSYAEYWEGSAELARYYREAYLLREKRRARLDDFNAWNAGRYIHEAVASIFCSTKEKQVPYPDKPFMELIEEQKRLTAEEKEEAQREAELQFHQNLMRRFSNNNTAGG